jgi:hypothetical protein
MTCGYSAGFSTTCWAMPRPESLRRLLVLRREAEGLALAEEALGDRSADAFVRTGDEGDFHCCRLPVSPPSRQRVRSLLL